MDSIPHVIITGQCLRTRSARMRSECDKSASRAPASSTTSCEGREGHRAHHEEGLLHRCDGPPGSRGRHPKDVTRTPRVQPRRRSHAFLQPGSQGARGPDQEGDTDHSRPMIYTGVGSCWAERRRSLPVRAAARLSLHQHADGPGRVSRDRPPIRHARHARDLRGEHSVQHCDVLLAIGALRPCHRQPGIFLRQRTIIHIDIDPSSISSASGSTCPSSATCARC